MARAALVALLAAAVLVAGCGGREREPPAAQTSYVTVVVWPKGPDGRQVGHAIECPQDKLCARIARADFAPETAGRACTQIYGGPASALVTGRVGNRQIHALFDLHDGCAISRWQRFSWLLGDPPGVPRGG